MLLTVTNNQVTFKQTDRYGCLCIALSSLTPASRDAGRSQFQTQQQPTRVGCSLFKMSGMDQKKLDDILDRTQFFWIPFADPCTTECLDEFDEDDRQAQQAAQSQPPPRASSAAAGSGTGLPTFAPGTLDPDTERTLKEITEMLGKASILLMLAGHSYTPQVLTLVSMAR